MFRDRISRLIALVGLALGAVILRAVPAGALGCAATFSPPTLTASCSGTSSTVNVAAISRDGSGNILLNGASISGGPTVTNTDSINVSGAFLSREHVTIDMANGQYAPGVAGESDTPEIEFALSLGAGAGDSLKVQNSVQNVKLGSAGINLDVDSDGDVTLTSVESVTIDGGSGIDTIVASGAFTGDAPFAQPVTLLGGTDASEDLLTGGTAADMIDGGPGPDVIEGAEGGDTLIGGDDSGDTLQYGTSTSGVQVNLATDTASGGDAQGDVISGFESLVGSEFDDTLTGTVGDNLIAPRGGADHVTGDAGTDTLSYAGSHTAPGVTVDLGTHTGSGGDAEGEVISGFENVFGSTLSDHLTGTPGANLISGGPGADILDGKGGIDTVSYVGGPSAVAIDLGAATASGGDAQGDVISGFENLIGTTLGDSLAGSSGPNLIQGLAGGDAMNGKGGVDTLDYHDSPSPVFIDLAVPSATGGVAVGDTIQNFENIIGSSFGDTLQGNAGNNLLRGGPGADTLVGRGGVDTADYTTSPAGVTVDLTVSVQHGGDAEGDALSKMEKIVGSDSADALLGDAANNVLKGSAGNDTLNGRGGTDTLDGGAGTDTCTNGETLISCEA